MAMHMDRNPGWERQNARKRRVALGARDSKNKLQYTMCTENPRARRPRITSASAANATSYGRGYAAPEGRWCATFLICIRARKPTRESEEREGKGEEMGTCWIIPKAINAASVELDRSGGLRTQLTLARFLLPSCMRFVQG